MRKRPSTNLVGFMCLYCRVYLRLFCINCGLQFDFFFVANLTGSDKGKISILLQANSLQPTTHLGILFSTMQTSYSHIVFVRRLSEIMQ